MNDERRPDEFALIDEIFAPLAAGFPGAFGLKDDAALIGPGRGQVLVATTDTFVSGRHIPADADPRYFARRLLRVNLSDLAAMGARPIAYLLAISLPDDVSMTWLRGLADGLAADQAVFGVSLIGGNTTSTTGPLVATVTAFGEVPPDKALRRSAARAGETVYVSGTIGDGTLGLMILDGRIEADDAAAAFLVERYRLPEPRLGLGAALRGIAGGCADVSDGVVADLGHICSASGLGAEISIEKVPLSDAARTVLGLHSGLRPSLITGGDDYELVFTARPSAERSLARIAASSGVRITPIGRTVAGKGVAVRAADGTDVSLASTGYRHF